MRRIWVVALMGWLASWSWGQTTRPAVWLGVQCVSLAEGRQILHNEAFGPALNRVRTGLVVMGVSTGGSLAGLGIERGDVLGAIDGNKLANDAILSKWLETAEPGKSYGVVFLHLSDGQYAVRQASMTAVVHPPPIAKRAYKAELLRDLSIGIIGSDVVGKEFHQATVGWDSVKVDYVWQNNYASINPAKFVRGFSGQVIFRDKAGHELLRSDIVRVTEPLSPGSSELAQQLVSFNEFFARHQEMKKKDLDEMSIQFEIHEIVFADWTKEPI